MALYCGLPWQWAERDPEYYSRTLAALGGPRWYNWKADCIGMDGYSPMVWQAKLGASFSRAQLMAQQYRGHTWLIGNEPERADQSNTSPAEFADAIRTWQALVGGRWAGPGILWGDEGRAWLDGYIKLDGPLPDIWAVHIYGSPDPADWLAQYEHLRRWLADRNILRLIWITETNGNEQLMRCLAADPNIVAFWYAARDPFGHNSVYDLHDEHGQLTHLGRVFAESQTVQAAGNSNVPRAWLPVARG